MRRLAVPLSVLLVVSSVPFQAQQQQQQADPVFRSSSNLVVFDVTVRDKSGKEIRNLKKEDFTLLEDGKPQNISVFEFQKLGDDTASANTAIVTAEPPKAAPQGRQQMITTTSPGHVQYQDKRLLVMLFDFSAMAIADQIRAQDSARQFIRTKMTSADLVSVMTNAASLEVLQDFTNDRDALLGVIDKFPIGRASDLAADGGNGDDSTGQDVGAAFSADETEFNIFSTDKKLAALESAAKMLAPLPEKKALLYFSGGISKQGVENQSQLRSTINAAVRANVSFYPIDARGLVALPPGGDASQAMSKSNGMFTGKGQQDIKDKFNDQQETLTTLAADTGGKAFLDDNDLANGIVNAQNSVQSYYIVGYYSSNEKQDGRYRRVQIKLAPTIQAKLDYRTGYFGSKTFAKFTEADKEQQLQEALMLGDPVTDLPLAVETDYFRLNRNTYFVPVTLKIPGSVIPLAKKRGKRRDRV